MTFAICITDFQFFAAKNLKVVNNTMSLNVGEIQQKIKNMR